jgi:hypothetical protein
MAPMDVERGGDYIGIAIRGLETVVAAVLGEVKFIRGADHKWGVSDDAFIGLFKFVLHTLPRRL